ncbi:MAG: hypothetical protein IGS48_15800 [Oscillatoriales cyanobacterium C42_A2020_001]|nr:hypothetical protein [Leptolyngbyaceae cyanobacterium C42_A2020_001]
MQKQVMVAIAGIVSIGLAQTVQATEVKESQEPAILRVREVHRPATTVKDWVAQMEAAKGESDEFSVLSSELGNSIQNSKLSCTKLSCTKLSCTKLSCTNLSCVSDECKA